jgi:hypothetical protein
MCLDTYKGGMYVCVPREVLVEFAHELCPACVLSCKRLCQLPLYVCIHRYVGIRMHTCAYAMCVFVHMYVCTYRYMYTYLYVYTMCMYTHVCMYTHLCMYTYMHAYMFASMYCVCICIDRNSDAN